MAQPKNDRKNHDPKKKDFDKRNPKDKDFKKKPVEEKEEKKSPRFVNDPAFYKLNPVLTDNVSRISFGNPGGLRMRLGNGTDADGSTTYMMPDDIKVPTFLALEVMPTIGRAQEPTDPINVAAKSVYSWVRHANSGHSNYDFPDLMIYLVGMREVYGYLGYLIRVMGCINKYNVTNREYPASFFELSYINYDDVMANQAKLRFFINTFAKQANSLSVPKKFPMYAKAFNMFANIFREGKSYKDQGYFYTPAGFLVYNATKYTTGGCLEYKTIQDIIGRNTLQSTHMTCDELIGIGNALLAPLLADEDIGIMSGDIRKAFNEDLYILGQIDTDLVLEPIVDAFELQIIHNATVGQVNSAYRSWGNAPTSVSPNGDIVQDGNGTLIQLVGGNGTPKTVGLFVSQLIDIDSDIPSSDEIIESALYKVFVAPTATQPAVSTYESIVGYTLSTKNLVDVNGDYVIITVSTSSKSGLLIGNDFQYVTYEWAPFEYNFKSYAGGYVLSVCGQFHNYSVIHKDVLERIHLSNMLSLLAIPAAEHLR